MSYSLYFRMEGLIIWKKVFRRCWWPHIEQLFLGIKLDTGGNIDRIRKPGILDEVRNRALLININR